VRSLICGLWRSRYSQALIRLLMRYAEILQRWPIVGSLGRRLMAMRGNWPPEDFPLLTDADWLVPPSPASKRYNCFAWSVGRTNRKWWNDPWGIGEWFPGIPREPFPTVPGFTAAYASIGYVVCADGTLEAGFEKIALYAKLGQFGIMPTHAAYQLSNGNWTSKLGDFEDIEHFRVDKLHGPQYGTVAQYLRRPRQQRPPTPIN
jgi:hypothetical protein